MLEFASQIWSPKYCYLIDKIESVRRFFTKKFTWLEKSMWHYKFHSVSLFTAVCKSSCSICQLCSTCTISNQQQTAIEIQINYKKISATLITSNTVSDYTVHMASITYLDYLTTTIEIICFIFWLHNIKCQS